MAFWKKKTEDFLEGLSGSDSNQVGTTPLIFEGNAHSRTTVDLKPAQAVCVDYSNPEEVLHEKFGKTRSALSAGTVIQGKLSFDTPVRIDGKLSGEVYSSKTLIIGPTGQVDAQLEVSCLVVLGVLRGNARVSERIEIWAGGRIEGDIACPIFVVHENGSFSGDCKMVAEQKKAQPVKAYERGLEDARAKMAARDVNSDKVSTDKEDSLDTPAGAHVTGAALQ